MVAVSPFPVSSGVSDKGPLSDHAYFPKQATEPGNHNNDQSLSLGRSELVESQ